ncbi:hypothetical protein AMIS_78540 [Actinoplanes missouriensis 431]|uniref:Uncharacterized protein n=1 Tax=Actinoplanes missouriensis (strain ATCC 14538 / DSM 43046 / CBS 188.64 / JCM 3121 / NBRC 102363 / NCIMB 12654 / NRRL B-3342 / UNCC 431) TaxID=512565 RepID=I0HJ87_ACTM4|nr:hypothetical protein [Actinoplanes missouriensis]BAL93074.1 hypothetical protein AMIS_78540 [Actinoplanes missouriensis 431]
MSGSGSAQTPPFQVDEKLFTVRIACIGGGELQLFQGEEKVEVSCDGSTRRVHVNTDAKEERVPITASAKQEWTVSIVVTKDFSTAGATPTADPSASALG